MNVPMLITSECFHPWQTQTQTHPIKPHLTSGVQYLATCSSVPLACVTVQDTMRAKRQADTHTLHHTTFQLWHCSSGGAVTQAGAAAAALVRDLECRGNCQARRHGNWETGGRSRCKTDCCCNWGGWFIWASILDQDVDTLLAASTASQSQRRLPLSIPIPNITAILKLMRGRGDKKDWIRLCNYPIYHILRKFYHMRYKLPMASWG